MSELDSEKKGPFYYWSNKDLRGKSLDFEQKWWLGTQLAKKLASVDKLIETYHLSRRTLKRYEAVVRKNGKFGGKRREVSSLSEHDKLFMANIARDAGVSPDDPRPHIQSILHDVLYDSTNLIKSLR